MDFKKIEWIFFIAFLGLNIFLFSIYHEAVNQENNVIRYDQTESIQQRLASDDITYEGKLSTEVKQGYYLSAEQTGIYESLVDYRKTQDENSSGVLKNGVSVHDNVLTNELSSTESARYMIDPENVKDDLNKFLRNSDNVLFGREYVYMPQFSSLDNEFPEIEASQQYEGIPFHDDTSKLTLTIDDTDDKLKITKYSQTHLSHIEQLREKMDLYSEEDAVKTLYINNKISSGSKILWRKLAYTRILKVREKNVYVPVWYIAIETNDKSVQIETVNALNNTIITNNAVPKVEDQ